jgi:hypothetical protein
VLINCSLRSNSATNNGGAMYNLAVTSGLSSPVLTNCSLQGNSATNDGGAMYNDGSSSGQSSPVLTNCSLLGNTASNSGGAMYNNGNTAGQSNPVLTNSIFWNNGGGNAFINSSATGAAATYSLFDNPANVTISGLGNLTTNTNPFVSATDLRLAAGSPAINTGNLAAYNTANGPATDLAGNARFRTANGTTSIDMGALQYQGALPVTLRYVNGRMTDAGALLGWATAREDNNASFHIERSRNALGFESIATIPSQAPDGNSVTELIYSYLDAQPLPGIKYYRLIQTDRDGTRVQVGNIIALSKENQQPVLFPNPVSAAGEASIEPGISHTGYVISDVLGRVVQRQDAPGMLSQVSLAGLPAGVYVLRVQTDGGPKTWRVLR